MKSGTGTMTTQKAARIKSSEFPFQLCLQSLNGFSALSGVCFYLIFFGCCCCCCYFTLSGPNFLIFKLRYLSSLSNNLLLVIVTIPWRRAQNPTPVFLPGESNELSLEVYVS